MSGTMSAGVDWVRLAALCTGPPLPALLREVSDCVEGLSTLELWLWDHQHRSLAALSTGKIIDGERIHEIADSADGHCRLLYQGDDLGLLTAEGPTATASPDTIDAIGDLLAATVRASEVSIDTIKVRRRRERMAVPAEIQWSLLPPTQYAAQSVAISAAVEPAYETGGDVFDYAIDGDQLFFAVLDARGHGLRSASISTVAASAMRRSRRGGNDLETIATDISSCVGAVGDEFEFVSAVLGQLDLSTWEGRWLSAGHLPPLLVGDELTALDVTPALPLGLAINGETSAPTSRSFRLEERQSLVLYSDGIVENISSDDGQSIGEARFHGALRHRLDQRSTSGHVARAVVQDLMDLTGHVLRDDATLLVIERT